MERVCETEEEMKRKRKGGAVKARIAGGNVAAKAIDSRKQKGRGKKGGGVGGVGV